MAWALFDLFQIRLFLMAISMSTLLCGAVPLSILDSVLIHLLICLSHKNRLPSSTGPRCCLVIDSHLLLRSIVESRLGTSGAACCFSFLLPLSLEPSDCKTGETAVALACSSLQIAAVQFARQDAHWQTAQCSSPTTMTTKRKSKSHQLMGLLQIQ